MEIEKSHLSGKSPWTPTMLARTKEQCWPSAKLDGNVLTKKHFYNYNVLLRKQPSISTYSANSMILLLLNILLQYFIHFI